jgi:arsenate reductase (glutaredoxin)
MKARIYHNPRCSKSRATLALLTERAVEFTVVDYLATPLSKAELRELARKLGAPPLTLVRAAEPEFRAYVGRVLGDDEIFDLLVLHPRLLQRPIVEVGGKARIGRPPERVLELFA